MQLADRVTRSQSVFLRAIGYNISDLLHEPRQGLHDIVTGLKMKQTNLT